MDHVKAKRFNGLITGFSPGREERCPATIKRRANLMLRVAPFHSLSSFFFRLYSVPPPPPLDPSGQQATACKCEQARCGSLETYKVFTAIRATHTRRPVTDAHTTGSSTSVSRCMSKHCCVDICWSWTLLLNPSYLPFSSGFVIIICPSCLCVSRHLSGTVADSLKLLVNVYASNLTTSSDVMIGCCCCCCNPDLYEMKTHHTHICKILNISIRDCWCDSQASVYRLLSKVKSIDWVDM